MRKKVITLTLVALVALCLSACGGGDTTSPEGTDAQETEAAEQVDTTSGTIDKKYDVTIGDATFGTDYEGKKMIVVHYSFANNSEEAATPLWSIGTKAFQNGVELEVAIGMDSSTYDSGTCQKELKPGASLDDCQIAYVLEDDSDVTFEVSKLFSSKADLTKTFTVAQ